jgi:hypothetical protein
MQDGNKTDKPIAPPDDNSGWTALKALVDGFSTTFRHLVSQAVYRGVPGIQAYACQSAPGPGSC